MIFPLQSAVTVIDTKTNSAVAPDHTTRNRNRSSTVVVEIRRRGSGIGIRVTTITAVMLVLVVYHLPTCRQ